jgi:hypothetical protein
MASLMNPTEFLEQQFSKEFNANPYYLPLLQKFLGSIIPYRESPLDVKNENVDIDETPA